MTHPEACNFTIGKYVFSLSWLYPFLAVFIITGSSNAYNLTDGLDGLAAGCGIPSFLGCAAILFASGQNDLAIISAAVAGALVGFLKYNKPKAEVFMGDTGSLAIGGLLGTIAVLGKFEFLLIFLGAIFVMETLSVIIQVTSFKTTGKRVFKMSPIHHHFELCGWDEKKIVKVFSFCSFFFTLIAIMIFELFNKGVM